MKTADLIELIEETGFEPRSYSGRGMYGKQCVGVDVDSLAEFIANYVQVLIVMDAPDAPALASEAAEALRFLETDSMGVGLIVYFPRFEWVDK